MKLIEKYISIAANAIKPDLTKIEISNESYAICEFLEALTNEMFRGSLNG